MRSDINVMENWRPGEYYKKGVSLIIESMTFWLHLRSSFYGATVRLLCRYRLHIKLISLNFTLPSHRSSSQKIYQSMSQKPKAGKKKSWSVVVFAFFPLICEQNFSMVWYKRKRRVSVCKTKIRFVTIYNYASKQSSKQQKSKEVQFLKSTTWCQYFQLLIFIVHCITRTEYQLDLKKISEVLFHVFQWRCLLETHLPNIDCLCLLQYWKVTWIVNHFVHS